MLRLLCSEGCPGVTLQQTPSARFAGSPPTASRQRRHREGWLKSMKARERVLASIGTTGTGHTNVIPRGAEGLLHHCRAAPRRMRWRVILEKKFSTALSQIAEVGVKWKVQRGWRVSQASTLGCLWVA